MQQDDPQSSADAVPAIPSLLSQESVPAVFSGAAETLEFGGTRIEGVKGFGDRFMLGQVAPEPLPSTVITQVESICRTAAESLGSPFRMEWVYDGTFVWLVQLNQLRSPLSASMVFAGAATSYRRFNVDAGLPALRELALEVKETGEGIILVGRIGWTSHMCDLLRQAQIPSRIEEN